jgi:hypothetical protein
MSGSRRIEQTEPRLSGVASGGRRQVFRRVQINARRAATLHSNIEQLGFELIGPIRAAPHPRPPAARIIRAYKLRQQPVEAPGAWTARGSFCGSKRC